MKVTTKLVVDLISSEELERVWYEWDGEVELAKGGPDPYAQQAQSIRDQQEQLSQQQQQFAQQQEKTGQANQDTAQGTLNQFEGPVEQSPFYKALLTSGVESTSNAYQAASRNARSRAQQAGFGYDQPVAQGAEGAIDAAGASALASAPTTAMTAAAPMSLQAAGQTANLGTAQAGEGVASSSSSDSSLANATQANQSGGNLQDMANKRKSGLFKTLAGVGLLAAAPFTGGATLAPGAGLVGSGGI